LWKVSDQPILAKKHELRQKNAFNKKVIPANQGAQEPALLERKRKLIVEETKDEKKLLDKKKE
jgi:hypothetical protein